METASKINTPLSTSTVARLQQKGLKILRALSREVSVNSPCPPPAKFVITRTKTALEPYIYAVERSGTTGTPPVKIRCMGQHELRGVFNRRRSRCESDRPAGA